MFEAFASGLFTGFGRIILIICAFGAVYQILTAIFGG